MCWAAAPSSVGKKKNKSVDQPGRMTVRAEVLLILSYNQRIVPCFALSFPCRIFAYRGMYIPLLLEIGGGKGLHPHMSKLMWI